ncbi:Coiled-coil domain-containing protein 69 [Microtus ochrogaster]|uniref:Coiled-coil domain-containing protein 69 n=1 Tax=Microtus ochrogaster TaxID=79684 RepID=A0A8J6G1W9_MICOH|nr:Coiled-coil domain-containing protein 69 [Microtus ochrogaster]
MLASSQETIQAQMNKVEGSILSQLYKNHIQDYGSPGPFWEQELESLHHVIEMKNERIHELEKQLLLLEMLAVPERSTSGPGEGVAKWPLLQQTEEPLNRLSP